MIQPSSGDLATLVGKGHDLTTLGLDLNQTEPLHINLASIFTPTARTRPLADEFTLPQCYTVPSVLPLHERIPSLGEETLFYIFYTMTRDIHQELAAEELNQRKWRYHIVEKMWVTRDESFPNPVEIEKGVSESGTYIWWDYQGWRRVRRQYVLRYADLDNRANRAFRDLSGFSRVQLGGPQGFGTST